MRTLEDVLSDVHYRVIGVDEAYAEVVRLVSLDVDRETQVDRLARFITELVPGEPSQSQGAVDTAIRLLTENIEARRTVTRRELALLVGVLTLAVVLLRRRPRSQVLHT